MGIVRTYSLSNVRFVLGGVLITGFGRDDAFSWQWTQPLWQRTTGQDGDSTYARNLEKIAAGRLTLLGTSRAYSTLYDLLEAQSGDTSGIIPATLLPLQWAMNDAHTGDFLGCNTTMIMTRPSPSKGQNLGDAVFGIELPNATFLAGRNNLLQAAI